VGNLFVIFLGREQDVSGKDTKKRDNLPTDKVAVEEGTSPSTGKNKGRGKEVDQGEEGEEEGEEEEEGDEEEDEEDEEAESDDAMVGQVSFIKSFLYSYPITGR
jgi:hypothetical protein